MLRRGSSISWIFFALVILQFFAYCWADNACCSYPCQNRGVCVTTGHGSYVCDCTNLDFYGDHCQYPTFMKRLCLWLKPDPETVHYILVEPKLQWIWSIIHWFTSLHHALIKQLYLSRAAVVDSPPIYNSGYEYATLEAAFNSSYYARALPPVPRECPTPMGTKGPKNLPDANLLVQRLFVRRKFLPEPTGSSLLFPFFAQHFSHTFFKTDHASGPGFQWGGHGVDVSNIYGKDKETQNRLRLFSRGKLKMRIIKEEEYPMTVDETGVDMWYPEEVLKEHRYALGHQFFALLPGLFVYSTIWMREHNRVCDVMARIHPDWDDERLFQTARLILLGETVKIVIEDYVQHISNYNLKLLFRPEVLFGEPFQHQNRIMSEFKHMYLWHPLMPEQFNVSGTIYDMKDYKFHSEMVIKHGMANFVDALSRQRAGFISHHNHGPSTQKVVYASILQQRELRFQPFNNYRRHFNLRPFESFEDLTGEKVLAAELEKLYLDVDAVELFVGVMLEKRRYRSLFGSSFLEINGPFSIKGLLSNAICSPLYWKPSTFGGDEGFEIVKTASMQNLFCKNIPGKCPLVSFRVPDFNEDEEIETWDGQFGHDEL